MLSIGADHREYRSIAAIPAIVGKDEAAVIVLGNDGHGITPAAKKLCDVLLKIPGSRAVESLNVAQAGTLFCSALAEVRRQISLC